MKSSTQNVALYQLSYNQVKTYLLAALFIVGNIVLPQLCHLIPQGGLIFLPIYFFTLVAAYKYGFTVGLTTAVLSPLVNSTVVLAVVAYQLVGSLAEWAMTGSIEKASQDIILGWPGCLIQIVGGYVILRYLLKK